MLVLTNTNVDDMRVHNETWAQQLKDAMNVNGGDIENASAADYVMHFLTFGFKVYQSLIESNQSTYHPQTKLANDILLWLFNYILDHLCINSTSWNVGRMAMFLCISWNDWIVDSNCWRSR